MYYGFWYFFYLISSSFFFGSHGIIVLNLAIFDSQHLSEKPGWQGVEHPNPGILTSCMVYHDVLHNQGSQKVPPHCHYP